MPQPRRNLNETIVFDDELADAYFAFLKVKRR